MKQIEILVDFAFAHRGYERREYTAGEVVETDDADLVEVATREGWAKLAGSPDTARDAEPESKSKKAAPENKSRSGA